MAASIPTDPDNDICRSELNNLEAAGLADFGELADFLAEAQHAHGQNGQAEH